MATRDWPAFQAFRRQQRRAKARLRPRLLVDVLRFAASDPAQFSAREWTRAATLLHHLHARAWLDEARVVPPDRLVRVPEASHLNIERFHRELRKGLTALFPADDTRVWERRTWQPPAHAHRSVLFRQQRRVWQALHASWPDTLWISVMSLLDAFGSQIRRCAICPEHRWFVKTTRQEYCSPQCSQRARSARWYRRHREEARQRQRALYERRVLKGRIGKVARRPRTRA